MIVAGIDEAGRGPLVGPMVIAGLAIEEARLPELTAVGVKDSKKLTPKKRDEIAAKLRSMEGVTIVEEVISPAEIDAAVLNRSINLNGLEIMKIAKVLEAIKPEKAFIDLVGQSPEKFMNSIRRLISCPVKLAACAKADAVYVVTGAASIIAKTRRDHEVAQLAEQYAQYGPLGSGYPADPITVKFMEAAHAEKQIFRRTWACYKNRYGLE